MLSSCVGLAGPAIQGLVNLQLASGDNLVAVGFVLGDNVSPLRDSAFSDADCFRGCGGGFEVRQNVGFSHVDKSTAC